MKLSLDELSAKIRSGETPEKLAAAAVNTEAEKLLRRAALPHFFDQQMVDEVLRRDLVGADPEAIPFTTLVGDRRIERVPRGAGLYRVREAERRTILRDWLPTGTPRGGPEFQRLSRALTDSCKERGAQWSVEQLYHLIAVEISAALKLFGQLYDEADAQFDLAGCQDLVNVLGERKSFDGVLATLYDDRSKYLEARGMWADEYYRTAKFFRRARLDEACDIVLGPKEPWILHLFARGGMGKTMFLRHLIARRCVLERIPCARIDFDEQDAEVIVSEPWRLLHALARQLDRQLIGGPSGGPFASLLSEADEYARPGAIETVIPAKVREKLEKELPGRFTSILGVVSAGRPIVVIFDTMEEAFRSGTNVLRLIEEIEKLRTANPPIPSIRLVLAGRFDLREKLHGFKSRFGAVAEALELEPFDEDECRRFLIEGRGLPLDSAQISMLRAKTGGVPWKLAFVADLGPKFLSSLGLGTYDLDVAYLVERVLLHVPPDVRWLVRYGVVPRRLTRAFVEAVIYPYLAEAMSGPTAFDDAADQLQVPEREDESAIFPHQIAPSPIGALWQQLTDFAGTYATAWVWFVGQERDTLVFQADVLRPMRAILSKKPVWSQLHRDAATFFETRSVREAIYHRFQADGLAAETYWKFEFERAAEQGDVRLRREIALEIMGEDYVDEDGRPLPWGGDSSQPIVSVRLLARAAFEVAKASLELAQAETGVSRDTYANAASSALAAMERWNAIATGPPSVSPTEAALIGSRLWLHRGQPARGLDLLEAGGVEPSVEVSALLGDLYAAKGDMRAAVLHYSRTLPGSGGPADDAHLAQARLKLAAALADQAQYDRALSLCEQALQRTEGAGSETAARLRLLRGHCYRWIGRPARAQREYADALDQIRTQRGPIFAELRVALEIGSARALLGAGHPRSAEHAAERAGSIDPAVASAPPELLAETYEVKALILGHLAAFESALGEIDRAMERWRQADKEQGVARCLLFQARLFIRELGRLDAAGAALARAERASVGSSDLSVRVEILRAELDAKLGRGDPAKRIEGRLVDEERRKVLAPSTWVEAVASALALGVMSMGERLADALEAIDNPGARLVHLESLARCPALHTSDAMQERLLALTDVDREPITADESPLTDLRRAELLRVLGHSKAARTLLARTAGKIRGHGSEILLRDVLSAWDRLAVEETKPISETRMSEAIVTKYSNKPLLCTAVMIEQAERLLRRGSIPAAREALNEAERHLKGAEEPAGHFEQRIRSIRSEVGETGSTTVRSAEGHSEPAPLEQSDEIVLRIGRDDSGQAYFEVMALGEGTIPTLWKSPLQSRSGAILIDLARPEAGTISHALVSRLSASPVETVRALSETMSVLSGLVADRANPLEVEVAANDLATTDLCLQIEAADLQAVPWELTRLATERAGAPLSARTRSYYRCASRDARRKHRNLGRLRSLSKAFESPDLDLGDFPTRARRLFSRSDDADMRSLAGKPIWDGSDEARARELVARRLRARLSDSKPLALIIGAPATDSALASDQDELLKLFDARGFRTEVMSGVGALLPSGGPWRSAGEMPSIVYIGGPMAESQKLGGAYVDLSIGGRGGELLGAMIDRLLQRVPAATGRPPVIVDVPLPRGPFEAMVQLFLRNAFAAELFALGNTPAVLATGLSPDRWRLLDTLLSSLRSGDSLARIADCVRKAAVALRPAAETEVPTAWATALFAYDPEQLALLPR